MQLNTKQFGMIEVDNDNIISFSEGIPGFEYIKEFIIIDTEDPESPFKWMQSIDYPEYTFVIIDPFKIDESFYVDIPESDVDTLGIDSISDINIYCIVVIPEDISKMTANLKAPVVINNRIKKGKQVLPENSPYSVKHYLVSQPE